MIFLKFSLYTINLYLLIRLTYIIKRARPSWNKYILFFCLCLLVFPCFKLNSIYSIASIHFFILWILFESIQKYRKHIIKLFHIFIIFVFTLSITCLGMINMQNIQRTEYTINTNKQIDNTKIIALSDLHYPTTMSAEKLNELIAKLKNEEPSFYLLVGDIVDEFTTKNEMNEVFHCFGVLTDTAPVFYVLGNHDLQKYNSNPDYSKQDLINTLNKKNIQFLEDTACEIGDITLIGREDHSQKKRQSIFELIQNQNKENFMIVADHKPIEMSENAYHEIDLQISGHTHNGQVFPVGYLFNLLPIQDSVYGLKQINDFYSITTSGVAGWGFNFRTQGISEYVVINIKSTKKT